MAVVIRLQRTGKPKQAYFRVVAIERSHGPTGKPLEVLGSYDPRGATAGKKLQLRQERYEAWIKNGAKASETVIHLVRGLTAAAAAGARKS